MLKTAPPATIEEAHAEAFAQLTPEQRRLVLQKIGESVPASERMFGQAGGMGLGGVMAGSLRSSQEAD